MKKGFTLSEVLLTLVVIGVVATLTIPVAFHGYTKIVEKTAKEKFVKDFNSALENYYNDSFQDFFSIDHFLTYLNIQKYCGCRDGCIPEGGYKFIDSNGATLYRQFNFDSHSYNNYIIFILSNGNIVIFDGRNNIHQEGASTVQFSLYVDINGYRGPNEFGRDLHCFYKSHHKRFISPCSQ